MRYLGIDYGSHTIGLALSDESGAMGFPHGTLPNDRALVSLIGALVAREGIGTIVIGESLALSGAPNPLAARARALGEELARVTHVPIVYEDERLTTQEARRAPDGMRSAGAVDARAAALILTSYLSRHHG